MSGLISKKPELRLESYDRIVTEMTVARKKGFTSLGFLGGEPTIHPRFCEIVACAKSLGFLDIELVTNGSRTCDLKYLMKIISAGLTRISVSIHSAHTDLEDRLLGGAKGALGKKIKTIHSASFLYRRGILKHPVSCNVVINRLNYQSLSEVMGLIAKCGASIVRLNYLQPEGNTIAHQEIVLAYRDFIPFLRPALMTARRAGIVVNFEAIPWCVSGLSREEYAQFSEDASDREKYTIVRNDIDPTLRPTLHQLQRRLELKTYFEKCRGCEARSGCEGVWKRYVDVFGESEFQS